MHGHPQIETLYPELRAIAGSCFRGESRGHLLQPNALISEAWIRIHDGNPVDWHDDRHFIAVATLHMRRVLVDHARRESALKRDARLLGPTGEAVVGPAPLTHEVQDLLTRLRQSDPQSARVVELKVFAGMTDAEIAQRLACSRTTVRRKWHSARVWLSFHLTRQ